MEKLNLFWRFRIFHIEISVFFGWQWKLFPWFSFAHIYTFIDLTSFWYAWARTPKEFRKTWSKCISTNKSGRNDTYTTTSSGLAVISTLICFIIGIFFFLFAIIFNRGFCYFSRLAYDKDDTLLRINCLQFQINPFYYFY